MIQIEVGGKQYTIDIGQVTVGDFLDAAKDSQSENKTTNMLALGNLVRKAMGDQIYEIPLPYYSYIVGQVMEGLMAPFNRDQIEEQLGEILDRYSDDDRYTDED